MTTKNRLAKSEQQPKRTLQEWCDKGNAYLRGEAPATEGKLAGQFIDKPRRDVHWVVRDGRVTIEWATRPKV